jgi:hypothetical protein
MRTTATLTACLAATLCIAAVAAKKPTWEYRTTNEQNILAIAHAQLHEGGKIEEPVFDPGQLSSKLMEAMKDGGFDRSATAHLADLGKDGWELVGVDGGVFWLKRQAR